MSLIRAFSFAWLPDALFQQKYAPVARALDASLGERGRFLQALKSRWLAAKTNRDRTAILQQACHSKWTTKEDRRRWSNDAQYFAGLPDFN